MATHNGIRLVGFLINDPCAANESEENEKIYFTIRVVNREVGGYHFEHFQDIIIFYDGLEFRNQIRTLKAYDLVDISGAVNVLTTDKRSVCPRCGESNTRLQGTYCFVYPTFIRKIDHLTTTLNYNEKLPEQMLEKYYKEVSNRCTILGTVVTEPEIAGISKVPNCRYRIAVDRKYYIITQDDLTVDYPYIYSFGKQAKNDMMYLRVGSLVMVDGFMRNRRVKSDMICENCGEKYTYDNIVTEIIPFGVEYLGKRNSKEKAQEIRKNLEEANWQFSS